VNELVSFCNTTLWTRGVSSASRRQTEKKCDQKKKKKKKKRKKRKSPNARLKTDD
jgi:hypothetical protein